MPEDSNGSALVALLWGLWVYGLFTFWFEHFHRLRGQEPLNDRGEQSLLRMLQH